LDVTIRKKAQFSSISEVLTAKSIVLLSPVAVMRVDQVFMSQEYWISKNVPLATFASRETSEALRVTSRVGGVDASTISEIRERLTFPSSVGNTN